MVRLANNLYFRDCKKRQEVLRKNCLLKTNTAESCSKATHAKNACKGQKNN